MKYLHINDIDGNVIKLAIVTSWNGEKIFFGSLQPVLTYVVFVNYEKLNLIYILILFYFIFIKAYTDSAVKIVL